MEMEDALSFATDAKQKIEKRDKRIEKLQKKE